MISVKITHCKASHHLAECPHYISLEVKGHATRDEDLYNPSANVLNGMKVCATITAMLCAMKDLLKDFGKVHLEKGNFKYECIYTKRFKTDIDYRIDTIVYTLWYLYNNYRSYFEEFTMEEIDYDK